MAARHRKPVTRLDLARARAGVALAKHPYGKGVENLPARIRDLAQWDFTDADPREK
jgi:hypothetical protein